MGLIQFLQRWTVRYNAALNYAGAKPEIEWNGAMTDLLTSAITAPRSATARAHGCAAG
jgi:hypothetical protein